MVKSTKKVPRRRNSIYYINGKEYLSVTHIIGTVLAKPALLYWYAQQAARIALADPELTEKEVYGKLMVQIGEAQNRGKLVHAGIDVCRDEPMAFLKDGYDGYRGGFNSWLIGQKPRTILKEQEVYSETYGYAGRLDRVCEINGLVWLLDFKTGKAVYREVGLQLAAYRHALEEMGKAKVDKVGAVVLTEQGEPLFKETNATLENFLDVFKVYKWIKGRE